MAYNSDFTGAEVEDAIRLALTSVQDISGKQDKNLYIVNKYASSWVSSSTYADYPYQCDIACNDVTADMYAEVVFDATESVSGSYAPICKTIDNAVRIYSKTNSAITIPTIIIHK